LLLAWCRGIQCASACRRLNLSAVFRYAIAMAGQDAAVSHGNDISGHDPDVDFGRFRE